MNALYVIFSCQQIQNLSMEDKILKSLKIIRRALALVICTALLLPALAGAELDMSGYTYEELQQIRKQLEETISEKDKEYARDTGDRRVTFEQAEITLLPGESARQVPEITRLTDSAPARTLLSWTSDNPDVVYTDPENGRITALTVGTAKITAAAKDNVLIRGEYTVTVAEPPEILSSEKREIALTLGGDEADASADILDLMIPESLRDLDMVWTSSNESVATVDQEGHVTAVAPGSALITVTSPELIHGSTARQKAYCMVSVSRLTDGLTLSPARMKLEQGNYGQLTARVLPDNADSREVKFTSSDTSVAAVSPDGKVLAKGAGECDIICETADGSGYVAKCHITVIRTLRSLRLDPVSAVMNPGEVIAVTAEALPADAQNRELAWTSSNPGIASVTDGGIVTAVTGGDCVITCSATDSSGLTAEMKVHVPTFSVGSRKIQAVQGQTFLIPVHWHSWEQISLSLSTHSPYLSYGWDQDGNIWVRSAVQGSAYLIIDSSGGDSALVEIRVSEQ